MTFVALFILSYFVGSIPFGLLLGRIFADVDVRTMGSGNIGATNVNRVLGRKLGAATLFCDVLKALLMTFLAVVLLEDRSLDHALIAMAVFLGHCYPVYLKFNGGKGVATLFGGLLMISAKSALLAFVIWILSARISKISSVGALSAAIVTPFLVYAFSRNSAVTFIFSIMSIILLLRHRDNISRLRRGVEK